MTQPDSIFGAELDRLKRLLTVGKDEPDDGPGEQTPRTASFQILTERPGGQIGRYKLLSILGEGGMGIVYLAQQEEPIKRQVALKVIKPGMDSKRVIARFEAERQALALLDHPNIAHVNDAGTTENGRPYFVMEYVKGLPITEHCDDHKLTIEDRLNLFRQVCLALHHAHQKGIIHRDIKPSNILVSLQDDRAVPKIIDFGVAKALAQPLTERTIGTEDSQLLGTLEYMSPEQADMANVDIDIRSDIYSLGVLLYVLLTGALPFDSTTFREGGIENIRRIIRQTDPKTPSTRLTKLNDEATVIAKNRRMEIHTLARHLRKELEWIPLKAMRKDRAERYRSASEFADDIDNYLNGAPLLAGPPGAVYRLSKFIRRNRALVSGIAAVLAVLVVGIIISVLFAIRAERALSQAQAVSDFLKDDVLMPVSYSEARESGFAYLNSTAERLEGKFKDQPLVEASIRETLGWKYRNIGQNKPAGEHLERAYEIFMAKLGQEHPDTLSCMGKLGWVYIDQGRNQEAAKLIEKALSISRRVFGEEHVKTLGFANVLGIAYKDMGRYDDAEQLYLDSIPVAHRVLGWKINLSLFMVGNLGQVYEAQGRYDQAMRQYLEILRLRDGFWDDENVWTLLYKSFLARVYTKQKRYDDAEHLYHEILPVLRRVVGNERWYTRMSVRGLAILYKEQEKYEEAEPLLLEAYEGRRLKFGDAHPHTIESIKGLIDLYEAWNKPEKAEQWRSQLPSEGLNLK